MAVAMTLRDYLDSRHLAYEVVPHTHTDSSLRTAEAAHVTGDKVAKPVLLADDDSYLLAVIPSTHRLEIARLNQLTARHLEMVNEAEVESTFSDCERGAIPAVGEPYGLDTVLDNSLAHCEDVYFEGGDHKHLIHMTGEQFRELMRNAMHLQVSHHL